jgi:hypothetical protein
MRNSIDQDHRGLHTHGLFRTDAATPVLYYQVLRILQERQPAGLFTVDFDVFLFAAVGDGDHDAEADQYDESDQCPGNADVGQNSQFPKRGQNTNDEYDITNEIHAGPFHDEPPVDTAGK